MASLITRRCAFNLCQHFWETSSLRLLQYNLTGKDTQKHIHLDIRREARTPSGLERERDENSMHIFCPSLADSHDRGRVSAVPDFVTFLGCPSKRSFTFSIILPPLQRCTMTAYDEQKYLLKSVNSALCTHKFTYA